MPLQSGSSPSVISSNISELTHHGSRPRSHAQIVAIALSNADRHPRASGGSASDAAWRIAHRDAGGYTPPAAPFFERQEARATTQSPYGFAAGVGLGRHDKNEVSVAPSSYVLPADIVAGLGDGNSLAGAAVWDKILASMPYGITAPRSTGHRGPPPPPHDAYLAQGITGTQKEPTLADGGDADGGVPIIAADGEVLVHPDDVYRIGWNYAPDRERERGDRKGILRRGHKILDAFIKQQRGANIRKLKGLRGPVGSQDANKGHT